VARLGGEIAATLADGRGLRVRDARVRDARPLARLLDAVAAEPTVTLLMIPGQFGAGVWRRRITDALADPRCLQLSAELDGELVGNLGLRPDPHPGSAHVAWVGMSVGARWRGLGVGGALLEVSATWAEAHAVSKLALGVFPENRRAIGFYERHGFVREGLRRAQYDRAGRYHDEVLMARFLTKTA
jgi:putative acetyltransferase